MYRVSYLIPDSTIVVHRDFESLELASKFALEQPKGSVFEIKLCD
jgi:hypothetical protein